MSRIVTLLALIGGLAPSSAAQSQTLASQAQVTGIHVCLQANASRIVPAGFAPNAQPTVARFELGYSRPTDTLFEVTFTSRLSRGGLLFVGTNHISSKSPELFQHLEQLADQFQPTEVYLEVADVSYLNQLPQDRETVIRTRGEPSYLGFIARERSIPVRPLELSQSALFSQTSRTFKPEHVALAHILRDIQIGRDRNRLFGEELERVAAKSLIEQRELLPANARSRFPRNIFELTRFVSKLWPNLDWRQVPAEWSNPLLTSDETGSKFVNSIFAEEKAIRDGHMLVLLLDKIASGQRVLALAGRSHAESLLKSLTCLMDKG